MKAEELRIKNWLYCIDKKENVEILPLGICDIYLNQCHEKSQNYQPILLTEDWLIKFGFEAHEDIKEYYKDLFGVCIDHEFKGSKCPNPLHVWGASFTDAPVLYVHQLQNLYFALTGEELKFN